MSILYPFFFISSHFFKEAIIEIVRDIYVTYMCIHFLLMPCTLLFLRRHTRIIQIAIQLRMRQALPLSNSAVPLHSCFNLLLYVLCLLHMCARFQYLHTVADLGAP